MASPWRRMLPDYGTYAKKLALESKLESKGRAVGEQMAHARARRGHNRTHKEPPELVSGEWGDTKLRRCG